MIYFNWVEFELDFNWTCIKLVLEKICMLESIVQTPLIKWLKWYRTIWRWYGLFSPCEAVVVHAKHQVSHKFVPSDNLWTHCVNKGEWVVDLVLTSKQVNRNWRRSLTQEPKWARDKSLKITLVQTSLRAGWSQTHVVHEACLLASQSRWMSCWIPIGRDWHWTHSLAPDGTTQSIPTTGIPCTPMPKGTAE